MLSPEDIKAEKHFLLGALVIGLVLLGINYTTGFFTRMRLHNEEVMAINHGVDSQLYKQMVDELIEDLHSNIDWKRHIAAVELGHLGAGAALAIPDLELLLGDEIQAIRAAAALALARIGSYSDTMVDPLLEVLQAANDHDKFLVVKALGLIGPDARLAIPLLQRELQTGHMEVKEAAREALQKIGSGDSKL